MRFPCERILYFLLKLAVKNDLKPTEETEIGQASWRGLKHTNIPIKPQDPWVLKGQVFGVCNSWTMTNCDENETLRYNVKMIVYPDWKMPGSVMLNTNESITCNNSEKPLRPAHISEKPGRLLWHCSKHYMEKIKWRRTMIGLRAEINQSFGNYKHKPLVAFLSMPDYRPSSFDRRFRFCFHRNNDASRL